MYSILSGVKNSDKILENFTLNLYNKNMENLEELKQVIAKNLISFRTSAGITQSELAEKINYSDKSVSKWERGLGVPDIFVLHTLANLYGVKVDDFLVENEKSAKVVIQDNKNKKCSRLLITLLASGLVWLVATLVFVVLLWIGIERAWVTFIVAIPICFIVLIVFSVLWGKIWETALFVSVLVWTIALSGCVLFYWTTAELLFLLCIPLQVLIILWYILVYVLKKKKQKISIDVDGVKK